MSIEKKVQTLLERAMGSTVPAEPQKKMDDKGSPQAGGADLGGANDGVAAAAAASKTGLPVGNNDNGEKTPVKQGSSESGDPAKEEEKLDDTKPGVTASANAGKTGLPVGNNNGGDSSPPAQGSSNLATPGQGGGWPVVIDGTKFTKEEAEAFKATLTESGIPAEAQDKILEQFEKAVMERVATEVERVGDSLVEAVETLANKKAESLYEDVNSYISYVAESWMEQNALAVEQGLRVEIAENFINGLKNLFAESYVEVPEGKEDLYASAQETIKELEAKVNEATELVVKLTETNRTLERQKIVEQATRDMAATEAEKFAKLVEDVEFDTLESFSEKVATLKERYYPKNPGVVTTDSDNLDEETQVEVSPVMQRYVAALSGAAKLRG